MQEGGIPPRVCEALTSTTDSHSKCEFGNVGILIKWNVDQFSSGVSLPMKSFFFHKNQFHHGYMNPTYFYESFWDGNHGNFVQLFEEMKFQTEVGMNLLRKTIRRVGFKRNSK